MSRRQIIGEASQLLASSNTNNKRGPSHGGREGSAASARTNTGVRSGSSSGGPTHQSYAARTSSTTNNNNNNNNNSSTQRTTSRGATATSRNGTPGPNRNAAPQPTPRASSKNASRVTSSAGLVNTPSTAGRKAASGGGGRPTTPKNFNALTSSILQQQQQRSQNTFSNNAHDNGSESVALFPKDLADRNTEFKTPEARASLRITVENERQLQELVLARRNRGLEILRMYQDESSEWHGRNDQMNAKIQNEERRRIELAAQARDVETEALNFRHRLRQAQAQARKRGEAAAARAIGSEGGFVDNSNPHSIIKSVLQRFDKTNGTGGAFGGDDDDDEGYDSGDDAIYAAILGKDLVEDVASNATHGSPSSAWFTSNGVKKKKRKLTKHERIKAAGKIAVEIERSLRTTRLSVESRAAELEASLAEIVSLENQKIGFGVSLDEMRHRVRAVHNAVKQASWMRSCLPLLEQTVRQREALAAQGEEYGKKVIQNLMALNRRDDENLAVLAERAERNLFKPEDVIRLTQEENQHMSRELGDAVRDAESWGATMSVTAQKYEQQLRETEKAIDEASKQRRSSTF